jgi:MFS family permease
MPSTLRALAPLLAAVFLLDALTTLVVVGYGNSYLLSTLHAPPSYPGYALAIYGLVKLLSAPAGGRILDGRAAPLLPVASGACALAGLGVILATGSANGFLGGVAALSAGIALAWLVVFHSLGHTSDPDRRGEATAFMGLISGAASVTGLGLAALFSLSSYWRLPFALGCALALAGALVLRRLPLRGELRPAAVRRTVAPAVTAPGPSLRVLTVVFAHFAVGTGAVAACVPFALHTLNLSLVEAFVLLGPAIGCGALAMLIAGRRSQANGRFGEVIVLYAIASVALAAAGVAPGALAFGLIAIPIAASLAAAAPVINAALIDSARAGALPGTALGALFFAEGLGTVAGPAATSLVIQALNTRWAMVALGVFAACLALFIAIQRRRNRL